MATYGNSKHTERLRVVTYADYLRDYGVITYRFSVM